MIRTADLEGRAALARTHDATDEGPSTSTRMARLVGFDPACGGTSAAMDEPVELSPELIRVLSMNDEEREAYEAACEDERDHALRAEARHDALLEAARIAGREYMNWAPSDEPADAALACQRIEGRLRALAAAALERKDEG